MAAESNPATRSADALVNLFTHCAALNEKEGIGALRAMLANTCAGTTQKDACLMALLKAVARLHPGDAWSHVLKACLFPYLPG